MTVHLARSTQLTRSTVPAMAQEAAVPGQILGAESFRASMSKLTTGVVLVTALIDDRPWGVTLSSVSSFSADPARLSLSVTHRSALGQHLSRHHAAFGVSILTDKLAPLAQQLATPGKPKFIPAPYLAEDGPTTPPTIQGAMDNLHCRVAHVVQALDHILVIADVVASVVGSEVAHARPLAYFDRSFGSFAPSTTEGDQQQ